MKKEEPKDTEKQKMIFKYVDKVKERYMHAPNRDEPNWTVQARLFNLTIDGFENTFTNGVNMFYNSNSNYIPVLNTKYSEVLISTLIEEMVEGKRYTLLDSFAESIKYKKIDCGSYNEKKAFFALCVGIILKKYRVDTSKWGKWINWREELDKVKAVAVFSEPVESDEYLADDIPGDKVLPDNLDEIPF